MKVLEKLENFDFSKLKDVNIDFNKFIEKIKNTEILDKKLSELADEVLKVLSDKLPHIEKQIWNAIDAVFAPRQFARQLALVFAVQAGLVTWRTMQKTAHNITSRMRKDWRLIKNVHEQMRTAPTYGEWQKYAELADKLEGHEQWRQDPDCPFYDRAALEHRINELTDLMERGDIFTLMFTLRGGISRPQYGMLSGGLYSLARSGTKVLVERYLATVCGALRLIAAADAKQELICTDTKLAFFNESRHAFGRTALMLSGGASLGFYHLGVVKSLLAQGLLPRVISGASAGSIVAAMVGTRTDAEMGPMFEGDIITTFFKSKVSRHRPVKKERSSAFWGLLVPPSLRAFASGLLSVLVYNENVLRMDTEYFRSVLRHNIGNYTFQEAFDRTGRIINITVSPINKTDPPRLLNYLTSPHVLVWSAAVCSASVPGVFDASTLLVKGPDGALRPETSTGLTFMDGSMEMDLPAEQLAELFNINHFIVSQVNPHAALLSNITMDNALWSHPVYGFATGLLGFLKAQVRAYTKHVVDLIILRRQAPSWSTRRGVGQLLTQEYEGRDHDITILPWHGYENVLGAFAKMVSNPTKKSFCLCVTRAERNTFAHVPRIRAHCAIEMTLEIAVRDLRRRLSAERDEPSYVIERGGGAAEGGRDRTPSFYTSPSLVEFSGLGVTDPASTGALPVAREGDEDAEEEEGGGGGYGGPPSHPRLSEGDLAALTGDAPAHGGVGRVPRHTQLAGTSFVKSTSMANFYYRRTKSFDQESPSLENFLRQESSDERSSDSR